MKKTGIFVGLTLLVAVAAFADGDYLETMRRRERLMMNGPRYARTQNPTLRAWALGEVELTAEQVHELRAGRQAKVRDRGRIERAEAVKQQWASYRGGIQPQQGQWSGLAGAGGYGGYYGQLMGLPGYSGGRGFGGVSAGGSGGGSPRCGAPTKTTGRPCRNPVKGGGRCHLHR